MAPGDCTADARPEGLDGCQKLFRPVHSYIPPDRDTFITLRRPPESGSKRLAFGTQPPIRMVPGFLSGEEAEQLMDFARSDAASWAPTSLVRSVDGSKYSSHTCSLARPDLQERFAEVAGVPLTLVEPLHLVRIRQGESHRAIHDGRHRSLCANLYLHDVSEGGETRFTKLGVQFAPEGGCLVMWPTLERLDGGSTEIEYQTLREELPASDGTKYVVQLFVNGVLDKPQLVEPGFERLSFGRAADWWSFPSLGDRYARDVDLQRLAQAYEKGLLVFSSGPEPFFGAIPNMLETSLLQALLELLQASGDEPWPSPRLLRDCVPGDDPGVASLEEQVKARVCGVLKVEPSQVEDIVAERLLPGEYMPEQHPGPHRAYSVLIYLSGCGSARSATTQFRHVPVRFAPARNCGLVWSNLSQDGRADPRLRRCERPLGQEARYQLLCHVSAGQDGAFGPAFARREWSVMPPPSADQLAKVMVGPGREFESSDEHFEVCPWLFRAPYLAVLKFLRDGRFLAKLPKTSGSSIHVNVPFCARFPECIPLTDFLSEAVVPQAQAITVLGSEYEDHSLTGSWRQKERYVERNCPGMALEMRQMDLAAEPLPSCSFALALHPEATKDGPWPAIIENLVNSMVAGGVCVICTFTTAEVESVTTTLDSLGVCSEVYENPFWRVHPVPTPAPRGVLVASASGGIEPLAPYMRYIMVISPSSSA